MDFVRQAKLRLVAPIINAVRSRCCARLPFHDYHVGRAAKLAGAAASSVLVVGCNTGEDCRRFIDLGFREVHGLDVIEEIGRGCYDPRIAYHRMSIEGCALPDNRYDLVYSFATMEHVRDVAAGFREMGRLVRPGGLIYSIASPLWNSPFGHHMGCFDSHPWIHLALTRDEIIDYAAGAGITGERGHSLVAIVDYMLHPDYFNQRPASDYRAATAALHDLDPLIDAFHREPAKGLLTHPLAKRAVARGYSEDEMLSVTHEFIARRR